MIDHNRYFIVAETARQYRDICQKWGLTRHSPQAVWASEPSRIMGLSPTNTVIVVHSDFLNFGQFKKWYEEITYNARLKNIPVEWDADLE